MNNRHVDGGDNYLLYNAQLLDTKVDHLDSEIQIGSIMQRILLINEPIIPRVALAFS